MEADEARFILSMSFPEKILFLLEVDTDFISWDTSGTQVLINEESLRKNIYKTYENLDLPLHDMDAMLELFHAHDFQTRRFFDKETQQRVTVCSHPRFCKEGLTDFIPVEDEITERVAYQLPDVKELNEQECSPSIASVHNEGQHLLSIKNKAERHGPRESQEEAAEGSNKQENTGIVEEDDHYHQANHSMFNNRPMPECSKETEISESEKSAKSQFIIPLNRNVEECATQYKHGDQTVTKNQIFLSLKTSSASIYTEATQHQPHKLLQPCCFLQDLNNQPNIYINKETVHVTPSPFIHPCAVPSCSHPVFSGWAGNITQHCAPVPMASVGLYPYRHSGLFVQPTTNTSQVNLTEMPTFGVSRNTGLPLHGAQLTNKPNRPTDLLPKAGDQVSQNTRHGTGSGLPLPDRKCNSFTVRLVDKTPMASTTLSSSNESVKNPRSKAQEKKRSVREAKRLSSKKSKHVRPTSEITNQKKVRPSNDVSVKPKRMPTNRKSQQPKGSFIKVSTQRQLKSKREMKNTSKDAVHTKNDTRSNLKDTKKSVISEVKSGDRKDRAIVGHSHPVNHRYREMLTRLKYPRPENTPNYQVDDDDVILIESVDELHSNRHVNVDNMHHHNIPVTSEQSRFPVNLSDVEPPDVESHTPLEVQPPAVNTEVPYSGSLLTGPLNIDETGRIILPTLISQNTFQ